MCGLVFKHLKANEGDWKALEGRQKRQGRQAWARQSNLGIWKLSHRTPILIWFGESPSLSFPALMAHARAASSRIDRAPVAITDLSATVSESPGEGASSDNDLLYQGIPHVRYGLLVC